MRAGQSSETPFTLQQWIPQDQYLTNTKIGLMRMTKKFWNSLKRNTKNTRLTSEIPAQYLARLPIQTYARQFRRGSETCKTPGWEKRLMKSSPLMHSRQYMVPRAQEPPHSLVQMELVFWLAMKLSWKDGLNTLMVSLIGYHLTMMKLSTDYHRKNVIRCLMSSQPSLKQWKQ